MEGERKNKKKGRENGVEDERRRLRKREGGREGQGGTERLPGPHFTGDFLYPLFLQY